jgi:predicted dehydrogenase
VLGLAQAAGVPVMSCHPRDQDPDLPYGWVLANRGQISDLFGPPVHIEIDMSYHQATEGWKRVETESFLLDHFPHEIHFLRLLLGDRSFTATRLTDGPEHYMVAGVMGDKTGHVTFTGMGTRLLNAGTFPETITLRCARGTCVVYTKSGLVRYYDHETQEVWHKRITPMLPEAYDRCFERVMREFARIIEGGQPALTVGDLLVINQSSVALAHDGTYTYRPV